MPKFKPRARSLDLLGRQQIAGVPTALNELFKNAYDAYADNVEVDYYKEYDQFVLRDDGYGMSKSDFESRWLTLGTESKLETTAGIKKPGKDKSKAARYVMGEKGIGRLAIAAIGPQVLIITRSRRDGVLGEYVLAFINWTMFELPGVDLEEIEIPVSTFDNKEDITLQEISNLVSIVKNNLKNLKNKTDLSIYERAFEQLSSYKFYDSFLNFEFGPLIENGGTHFIISPTNEGLEISLNKEDENKLSEMQRMLIGFTSSTLTEEAPIKTKFRLHGSGAPIEILDNFNFITQKDYDDADHHIEGEFDEYGNFSGKISIYQKEKKDIVITLNKSSNKMRCGKFKFKFGYLQGDGASSLLEKQIHTDLAGKLNQIGGVYVYRDGIRILPYGKTDFDFLNLEERRSYSLAKAFFSHRRMIGAVELSRKNNSSLKEKAGREGFTTNLAYRDFVETLENFLINLAQIYFSSESAYGEEWTIEKDRLKTINEALRKRKTKIRDKRNQINVDFDAFFKNFEIEVDNVSQLTKFDKITTQIISEVENKSKDYITQVNIADLAEEIIQYEIEILNQIRNIDNDLIVILPRGIGPNKKQLSSWNAYQNVRNSIVNPRIKEIRIKVTELISSLADAAKLHIDTKLRLEQAIINLQKLEKSKVNKLKHATNSADDAVTKLILSIGSENRKSQQDLEFKIQKKLAEVNQSSKIINISQVRDELEGNIEELSSSVTERYDRIKNALNDILLTGQNDDTINDSEAMEALESRHEMLQEEFSDNVENIQLGLAIKVINHEFSSNINGVRKSIRSLKSWADANDNLKLLYNQIRDGFDHLDNYLNLFTPLERRLNRRKIMISGSAIHDFILRLYDERLERHGVKINATPRFLEYAIASHASTLYPVFINLIDNSIYWLSTMPTKDKIIILDADKDGFIVSDNGPGISVRDKDNIFDLGFTRKVSGGGMGLYIAKTTLNKDGLDISLMPLDSTVGTQFYISELL